MLKTVEENDMHVSPSKAREPGREAQAHRRGAQILAFKVQAGGPASQNLTHGTEQ